MIFSDDFLSKSLGRKNFVSSRLWFNSFQCLGNESVLGCQHVLHLKDLYLRDTLRYMRQGEEESFRVMHNSSD